MLHALQRFGHHGNVELRSDGEPALVELLRHVAERRRSTTVIRRSPPADSSSNGKVERAVRAVEEAARVLKIDVETRTNSLLSVHTSAFAWILRHAVMLLNWRQSGADGLTSYSRLYGKCTVGKFYGLAVPF